MISAVKLISTLKLKISTLLVLGLLSGNCLPGHAQLLEESTKRPLVIRSGVHGVIGRSHLYLNDELRPSWIPNDYYQFGLDLFLKVGAMITVQPSFLGDYFEFVTDPSFSKYSWGNFQPQYTDSIVNEIDIDLEAIELPLSLRFTVLPYSRVVRPFIRGGYTLAWIIDKEALFRTSIYTEYTNIEYLSTNFRYAFFQHLLMLAGGVEFNFRYVDYTFELVIQKGEGIDRSRKGSSSKGLSNTTNYFFQLGILF